MVYHHNHESSFIMLLSKTSFIGFTTPIPLKPSQASFVQRVLRAQANFMMFFKNVLKFQQQLTILAGKIKRGSIFMLVIDFIKQYRNKPEFLCHSMVFNSIFMHTTIMKVNFVQVNSKINFCFLVRFFGNFTILTQSWREPDWSVKKLISIYQYGTLILFCI